MTTALMLSMLLWSWSPLTAQAANGNQTAGTAPKLVVQSGHNFSIQSIVFSRDGRWLATAGWDGNVKVWDAAAGLELATLSPHSGPVSAVAFSPDDRLLASAGNDHRVTVWDFDTGQQKLQMQGHKDVVDAISFSADGQWLVSGSQMDSQITIWSLPLGAEVHSIKGKNFAISPDGRQLAVDSAQGAIELYQFGTWHILGRLQATGRPVSFSPAGTDLAVASKDGVHVWDIKNMRETSMFASSGQEQDRASLAVAFDKSWKLMASSSGNTVALWDVTTKRQIWKSEAYDGPVAGVPVHVVSSLSFHPTQKLLVSGNWDNTISYWDLATGQRVRDIKHHTERLGDLVISQDGRWLACAGENQQITLWDLASDTGTRKIDASVGVIAFSADSSRMAVAGSQDTVVLKDVLSQRELLQLAGYGTLTSFAFSPDGTLLITATSDSRVHVWDMRSGIESTQLRFPTNPQMSGLVKGLQILGFTDRGRALIVFDRPSASVMFWSLAESRKLSPPLSGLDSVGSALVSADGHWLAVADIDSKSEQIRLYDLYAQEVRNVAGRRPLSFSHDGRQLAISSSRTSLQVLYTSTGVLAKRIPNLPEYSSAAFTPRGRHLFLATPEGTVLLYDLQSGSMEATLSAEWRGAGWIVVAPNGLFDGSSGGMQDLLAWKFEPAVADAGPIEMFLNEFYHPRLLSEVLAGRKVKAPRRIELLDRRQLSVSLEVLNRDLPENRKGLELVTARIKVREAPADAHHRRGSGVRDVRLFRNGSLVHVWRGNPTLDAHGEATLEASVHLASGTNRLSCYAFNNDNIKSADASVTVTGPVKNGARGTAYIIAVGINKYANKEYDLRYARDDADFFATELSHAQERTGLFARVKTIKLQDEQATRSNILNTLHSLGEQQAMHVTPDDIVFIYFAGHGLATKSRYYLIPHDLNYSGRRETVSADDVQRIAAESISDLDLQRTLEAIDAGRVVLMIDACNSGQALRSHEPRLGPINSSSFAQLAYEKGMYVLVASQSYQAAIESSQLGHGLLTYALIQDGLKNGAADFAPRDGTIGIQEWLNYAVMQVPELDRAVSSKSRALVHPEVGHPAIARGFQQPSAFYRRDALNSDVVIGRIENVAHNSQQTSTPRPRSAVVVDVVESKNKTIQSKTSDTTGSAEAILAESIRAYESLTSYQLEIRTAMKIVHNGTVLSNKEGISMFASMPPSKSRIENKGDYKALQVSDGFFTWQYDGTTNTYRQRTLIPLALPSVMNASFDLNGVLPISRKAWDLEAAQSPKMLREDVLKTDNSMIPCYIIKAQVDFAKGIAEPQEATYWIDKASHLVLRSELKSVTATNGDTFETDMLMQYTYSHLKESLPDSLFKFTPPEGAKERGDLPLPAEWSQIGKVAPQFTLSQLDGGAVQSAQLSGKVLVLTFWTSWCEPCIKQLEVIENVQKQVGAKSVAVFGVHEEPDGVAGRFLGQHKLSLKSLSDSKASLRTAYMVTGVPSTVVIDKNGRIAGRQVGFLEEGDLRKMLENCGIQ